VDADEWERRTQRNGSLADFFKASPLRGSGLKVRRSKERPRATDLMVDFALDRPPALSPNLCKFCTCCASLQLTLPEHIPDVLGHD
jgi:hypothetical protein